MLRVATIFISLFMLSACQLGQSGLHKSASGRTPKPITTSTSSVLNEIPIVNKLFKNKDKLARQRIGRVQNTPSPERLLPPTKFLWFCTTRGALGGSW